MAFQQASVDGVCLRYPGDLGIHPSITHENAISMLVRAWNVALATPFSWGYIDKPTEGQVFLIFMAHQLPFPNDGIRFQDQEQRYVFPAGANRELEVLEIKFGFVPGQDTMASRVRRRYRFIKGGHPQLILLHYTRGQQAPIMPSIATQPVRSYPLRPYNEPAVFVLGDRQGQKVYQGGLPGAGGMERGPSIPPNMMGMNFGGSQAMLAQQNSNMEALERRSVRDRDRSASMSARGNQQHPEDDDSADESDRISTRTLALTRYRRNHEFMNEVFVHAAFHNVLEKPAESRPAYSVFKLDEIESKIAKANDEIAELKAKAAARQAAREADERADISMEGLSNTSAEVMA